MTYTPQIDDYVIWKNHIEGWIYFTSPGYVTIEMCVRPKNEENYECCTLHRNERLLVLCFKDQWKELQYVKSRSLV